MRTFLALAETGSVTVAAGRLGRTQSAVSMQLRRLEESLGQALFRRQPRGIALTPRGTQLLPYARRVVGLLDEAATALRERTLTGPVRVGIPQEYLETVLPAALAAFAARHPAVEVTIRCDYSAPQLAALAAGELDLAVVFDWGSDPQGELLCVDPTVWATSTVHGQHRLRPVPVATYFDSNWCRELVMPSLDRQGIPWRVAFECDTTGGLNAAVRAGLAIAPLARSAMPPECRELTTDDGFAVIDASAVVLRHSLAGTSPAVAGLAAMLRAAFAPMAGAARVAQAPG